MSPAGAAESIRDAAAGAGRRPHGEPFAAIFAAAAPVHRRRRAN